MTNNKSDKVTFGVSDWYFNNVFIFLKMLIIVFQSKGYYEWKPDWIWQDTILLFNNIALMWPLYNYVILIQRAVNLHFLKTSLTI